MRKKVLLSLDDAQLARIDAAASAAGKTRSAWIAALVDETLEPEADARRRRSREAIAEIHQIFLDADPAQEPFDAVEEIRRGRAERDAKLDRILDEQARAHARRERV
jgi:hypothetical protein